jgi:two-component system, NtrC family, sensor kinase
VRLIIFILLLCAGPAFGDTLRLASFTQRQLIGLSMEHYEDVSGKQSISTILRSGTFNKSTASVPNYNLTESVHWFRFCLAPEVDAHRYLLALQNPLMNLASLYKVKDASQISCTTVGDLMPFSARKYKTPDFLFDIAADSNAYTWYYLQVKSHEPCQVPLYIGRDASIMQSYQTQNYLMTIFVTVLFVMFLYNLFIYISIRERSYLLYVLYILSVGVTQAAILGYGFKYLWGNNVWLQHHATFIFSSLTGILALQFFRNFIGKCNISKFFMSWIFIVIGGYIAAVILALCGLYRWSYICLQAFALAAVLVGVIAGAVASKNKVASANYFLVAWLVFIVGIVVFVLKDYDLVPYSIFSTNTMTFGSAIELVLLSFALANRIKILQRDKEHSQAMALAAAKENESIVNEQNVILESQVEARTQELQHAYAELKRSEVELVNKEKMSSLGVLTAGIAHEINNPINFVTASIQPLKRDFGELLTVLQAYRTVQVSPEIGQRLADVHQLESKLDTSYVIEEIGQLLDSIDEGATRTAEIVKGLQKFSRSDENTFKKSDLVDGLENTLTLLANQTKGRITIVKNFEAIPFVTCAIGRLNQVFLNFITNAIHSVNASERATKEIIISVKLVDTTVQITIQDNGIGMSSHVQQKIFDPFFTTKEVGQGTGLGLAISMGIILDHHGTVTVDSKEGNGASFTISLPVDHDEVTA